MNPVRPENPLTPEEAAQQWRRSLRARLDALGVTPAPDPTREDAQRLRDADVLLAQFVRASRQTSGAVRAFASLIADAHCDDENTAHWLARIERGTSDLDEFSARMSALRICDNERPVSTSWDDVLSRIALRCSSIAPCTIEVIDRTRSPLCQRAELLGRMLFQLVRNAMEATPPDGTVRVRVDEYRQDGARVFHARITDAGPGIDPAIAAAVWEPFKTSRPGHAGLGLAFVSVAAPVVGAAVGLRREANRTTAHMLVGEEGGLQWE